MAIRTISNLIPTWKQTIDDVCGPNWIYLVDDMFIDRRSILLAVLTEEIIAFANQHGLTFEVDISRYNRYIYLFKDYNHAVLFSLSFG